MNSSSRWGAKSIEPTGVWLFGGLTVLLVMGKVLGLWGWSWWRVALPLFIFLGFNGLYSAMGFLYLSSVPVRYGLEDEENDRLRMHRARAPYWAGFILLVWFDMPVLSRFAHATGYRGV